MLQEHNMRQYNALNRPRIQKTPSFYGDRLIDGVVIRDMTIYADERGFLFELMRLNDNEMNASDIKQIIASYSYPGMVKGWHLHSTQEDHLVCVTGMVKCVLYDYRIESSTYQKINEIFMGEKHPRAVYIPPGIFHGIKNIGQEIAVVIGMPSLLYDANDVDERRINPIENDVIPYDWNCRME